MLLAAMSTFTPEVIQSLGSAAAATLLSVFFIWTFTRFQERSLDRILQEMQCDRQAFNAAIEKIDRRLEIQENLITRLENRIDSK